MTEDFSEFVSELWRYEPTIIVLFVGGAVMLVLLLIDTHRHRKQRKERHRIKRLH